MAYIITPGAMNSEGGKIKISQLTLPEYKRGSRTTWKRKSEKKNIQKGLYSAPVCLSTM
jgi:hypothetical protein